MVPSRHWRLARQSQLVLFENTQKQNCFLFVDFFTKSALDAGASISSNFVQTHPNTALVRFVLTELGYLLLLYKKLPLLVAERPRAKARRSKNAQYNGHGGTSENPECQDNCAGKPAPGRIEARGYQPTGTNEQAGNRAAAHTGGPG